MLRRLEKSPDQVFAAFDLSEEERDILRHPDTRLLALLGRAVKNAQSSANMAAEADASAAADAQQATPVILANTLAPALLALTVVPCLNAAGVLQFAVWVNPMAEGTVPATLPPPPGATLPGTPLAPLYAVIELDGVRADEAEGNPQFALWAQLRQVTNTASTGAQTSAPCDGVTAAVQAVRTSPPEERYDKLARLLRAIGESEL